MNQAPRHFTQYWRNDTWELNRGDGHEGVLFDHTADQGFRGRGVVRGDHIYIVTIRGGRLYLLCRGTVMQVTTQRGAAARLGVRPEVLWDAEDHLLFEPDEMARARFRRVVPVDVVRRLMAIRADGPRPLKFRADGVLDQQALRGVCELTAESARLLDALIQKHPLSGRDDVTDGNSNRDRNANDKTGGGGSGNVRHRRGKAVYANEREFEANVIEPLITAWGFEFERQHRCHYRRGSQTSFLVVDHLVTDDQGPVTLFENKRRLDDPQIHASAREQARSYAKELNLPSFVLAAPEGLWFYALWQGRERLVHDPVPLTALSKHQQRLQHLLLHIRERYTMSRPQLEAEALKWTPAASSLEDAGLPALDLMPNTLAIHAPEASPWLDSLVIHVVRDAGPIAQDDVVQAVRRAWGLARAGRRVRDAIDGSIARQMRRGALRRERDKHRTLTVS